MTNISLSIIIVNYNTFKLTRDTINSCISEPTRYTYEIFLVDNKSTDDSLFQLKEYFKKEISRGTIKVIENDENRGFANANNLAIEKASGDFILLLNSDTLACKRSFPNPANSFYKLFNINTGSSKADYNLTGLDDNGVYEIDCLTGAFMLVRKTTIEDIGLLDDTFFMYGEDIDWCYRIKKAGWKIIYFGEAGIVHYKGASSEDKKTKRRNPKLVYEFYRAMYVFYRKHYTKKYNFLLNIAVYIGIFVLLVKNLLVNELKRF